MTYPGSEKRLPDDYTISFRLEAAGMSGAAADNLETQPMPEGAEDGIITITKTAAELTEAETPIEFGEITIPYPGTYNYTITEVNGGLKNLTYDAGVYTLTYTVTLNTDGTLTAVTAITRDETGADSAVFENTYLGEDSDSGSTEPPTSKPAVPPTPVQRLVPNTFDRGLRGYTAGLLGSLITAVLAAYALKKHR